MTAPGQAIAKAPASPHTNLLATTRVGVTKHGSATWRVECTCGHAQEADAPTIKRGAARCPDCNPSYGDLEAQRILAALPGTKDEIEKRTGMTLAQVRFRLTRMKPHLCHTGKWRRARGSGACQPVIVAGPGADVPCPLNPRTGSECNARYRKRIKKAIERFDTDGRRDERYKVHIARHQADQVVKQTRAAPHSWCSALMQHN